MNAAEFLVYGPASLWFLGSVVLLLALVQMLQLKHSKDIVFEMRKGRKATQELQTELQKIPKDLREDTSQLKQATSALNDQLGTLSNILLGFQKTMRHQFEHWFPFAAGENE